MEFIPRARYYFNDRWFFNLALPGRIVDVAFTFQELEDPSLEPLQQRTAGFDFGLFGEGLRTTIGVGTIF